MKKLKRFFMLTITGLMAIAVILIGAKVEAFKVLATDSPITSFSGIAGSPNGNDLYNATNTYNYKGNNTSNSSKHAYYDTREEGRNGNDFSSDAPLITVLTHGLEGDASHWSNEGGVFAYDKDSIFIRLEDELLKNEGSGANIYWAVMQNSTSFDLYDLKDSTNWIVRNAGTETEYIEYAEGNPTLSITDISKHIIIIFQSSVSDGYNYEVYEEFNYMLSKIIYDVKMLSGGELPRINLIGHSRGGITNLQYALDHPDLVASMFSLGTPYFGSDTASTSLGASFAPGNGRLDIISREIYFEYFNRWHDNYDRLYSNISAHALGGYSDSDYLIDALVESTNTNIETVFPDEKFEILKWAIKSLPTVVKSLNGTAEIADFIVSLFRDENYSESELESYIQIVADIQYLSYDDSEDFWENLWDNIVHNVPVAGCPYFMNDLLVDLSSQIGFDQHNSDAYRFYDFEVYTKCFENSDYADNEEKKLSRTDMPAVVHNLEARDSDMINYILSNISLSGYEGYLYKQTSSTTATLVGYSGNLVSEEIVLPTQVDGLTVTCIGSDLFKGKGENLTSIIIPNTVESLGKYAFAGLKSLTEITIPDDSNLTSIGAMAFSGCVTLETYHITKNVSNIASNAFINCPNLNSFSVDGLNSVYSVVNGALYNKAGTKLLRYPEGKDVGVLDIPLSVTEIEAYAFCNNADIEQLHIYGTPIIGNYAFLNCENLSEVYFYSYTVPEIGSGAFLNNEFTLYVPHSSQNAYNTEFVGYTDDIDSIPIVVTFISDGEMVQTLNTYYGAQIVGIESPFKIGYIFDYWMDVDGQVYQNGGVWNSTENLTVYAEWTPRQSYINFSGYGTEGIADKLVTYDEAIGELPTPISSGPVFIGWKDEHGTYYTSSTIWNRTNNLTLFADFEGEEDGDSILYYVDLDQDDGEGGSDNVRAEYMAPMPSATAPTRVGYTFNGYYTEKNGSGVKYYNADMSSARNWDIASDKTLYAYWVGLQYTITFNKQGGTGGTSSVQVTYGSVMPTSGLAAPTKLGYTFDGYYDSYNKQYYIGPNMSSDIKWDKLANTTLDAKWIKNEYEIILDMGYDTYSESIYIGYGDTVVADNYTKYVYERIGYDFKGFFSSDGVQYFDYKITKLFTEYCYELVSLNRTWNQASDGVLYACWSVISEDYEYEIVISNAEEDRKIRTIRLTHGDTVTITAPTLDGYIFEKMWVNGYYYESTTYQLTDIQLKRNLGYGIDEYAESRSFYLWYPVTSGYQQINNGGLFMVYQKEQTCVAEGSLITLANGNQVPVESLTGNEMLLVWNLHTGNFDIAPILFIDHDAAALYKIINLHFSDGTQVKVIYEHAFWDFNLNKYVFLREDAAKYLGHWFNKQTTDANGNMIWTRVQLANVTITEEYTTAWSPVTYGHLCIYVNGMLSMPGATEGLINIFEVNGNTMQINQEQYLADIEMYGLFTYEEFAEIYPIPEMIFEAFGGEYLKVSIAKGLIDYETLGELIERYSEFFE